MILLPFKTIRLTCLVQVAVLGYQHMALKEPCELIELNVRMSWLTGCSTDGSQLAHRKELADQMNRGISYRVDNIMHVLRHALWQARARKHPKVSADNRSRVRPPIW